MSRKSYNQRHYDVRNMKKRWEAADAELDRIVPRGHRFAFFRVGEDKCWVCHKTLKEHQMIVRRNHYPLNRCPPGERMKPQYGPGVYDGTPVDPSPMPGCEWSQHAEPDEEPMDPRAGDIGED